VVVVGLDPRGFSSSESSELDIIRILSLTFVRDYSGDHRVSGVVGVKVRKSTESAQGQTPNSLDFGRVPSAGPKPARRVASRTFPSQTVSCIQLPLDSGKYFSANRPLSAPVTNNYK
jgi:hypothetical protein